MEKATPRAFRGDFHSVVREGALLIARRGACRCLKCHNELTRVPERPARRGTAERCRTTWRSRRDYCQSCDPSRPGARFPVFERDADRARQEAIRVVFEWLAKVEFREPEVRPDEPDRISELHQQTELLTDMAQRLGADLPAHREHVELHSPHQPGSVGLLEDWHHYMSRLVASLISRPDHDRS